MSTDFTGIVKALGENYGRQLCPVWSLECRDKALAMTVGRKKRQLHRQKDSDIITSLISAYSGPRPRSPPLPRNTKNSCNYRHGLGLHDGSRRAGTAF